MVDLLKVRYIQFGLGGQIAGVDDCCIAFQIIDIELTGAAFEIPGHHSRTGKNIRAIQLVFPQPGGHQIHSPSDKIQQRPLVADAGDQLPGEIRLVFQYSRANVSVVHSRDFTGRDWHVSSWKGQGTLISHRGQEGRDYP